MSRILPLLPVALILFFANAPAIAQVSTAESELSLGLLEMDRGNSEAALAHLKRAIAIDPRMISAHLAIGEILDSWCGTNAERCEVAILEYKAALELDKLSIGALKNISYSLYMANRTDEADVYYRRALESRPTDPELLCGVAAIDVSRSWSDVSLAKAKSSISTRDDFFESPASQATRDRNMKRIQEGLDLLKSALLVSGNSTDIIGFLVSLYDVRAEIQCNHPQAFTADKNIAKQWDKRRKTLLKNNSGGRSLMKCPPSPPPKP